VAAEGLDDVLPAPIIAYSLADHLQAPRQRRLGDELVGPTGRQEFVFRDSAVALGQEIDEHGERLGFQGPHHTSPPQLPALDVKFTLAEDKDHRAVSCCPAPTAPEGSAAGRALVPARPVAGDPQGGCSPHS
jgi:hypothetical protein